MRLLGGRPSPRRLISHTFRARAMNDFGNLVEVPLTLHYDPVAPAEVSMVAGPPGHEAHWVFDRDLFLIEDRFLTGCGDIRVMHDGGGYTRILLSTPAGSALLIIDSAPLGDWLRRTFLAVQPGDETAIYMDQLDHELADLL